MTEPVFCKDCRHLLRLTHTDPFTGEQYVVETDRCDTEPQRVLHPINGVELIREKCVKRNQALDCGLFEPLPPPKPKRSLWARLFGL